jgi:hypothetical protein
MRRNQKPRTIVLEGNPERRAMHDKVTAAGSRSCEALISQVSCSRDAGSQNVLIQKSGQATADLPICSDGTPAQDLRKSETVS